MLYGCEMLVADSKYHIVYNNDHRRLEDATFVVFDLETTGLSNTRDEIKTRYECFCEQIK